MVPNGSGSSAERRVCANEEDDRAVVQTVAGPEAGATRRRGWTERDRSAVPVFSWIGPRGEVHPVPHRAPHLLLLLLLCHGLILRGEGRVAVAVDEGEPAEHAELPGRHRGEEPIKLSQTTVYVVSQRNPALDLVDHRGVRVHVGPMIVAASGNPTIFSTARNPK